MYELWFQADVNHTVKVTHNTYLAMLDVNINYDRASFKYITIHDRKVKA